VKHPFRSKNLSPRLLPVYLAGAALIFFAEPTAAGFAVGGLLALAGLGLRIWGAGHLVKNDRLTVSGPYAYLRHPLYAGSLLLAIGFAVIAGGGGALVVVLVIAPAFFLYYLPYKDRIESARLERHYGGLYAQYRERVPKLLPVRGAWCPPPELARERNRCWSIACFRDNSEAGTVVGVLLAAALFALRPVLEL